MAFVHLHVHTEYSDLDGMIRLKDLFRVTSEQGQNAVAITDHGNLGAMWAAQKYAAESGVKLIAGEEFYLANGSRMEKTPFHVPAGDTSADEDSERGEDGAGAVKPVVENGRKSRPYQHLTVLAYSPEGWRNLVILNNEAQESKWQKPRIDYALLKKHSAGLIALTGCLGGPVIGPISHGQIAENEAALVAKELSILEQNMPADVAATLDGSYGAGEDHEATEALVASLSDEGRSTRSAILDLRRRVKSLGEEAARYRESAQSNIDALVDALGRENVYVEIMDHGIEEESSILPQLVALARANGLPLVATNDAHHTHENDAAAQSAWLLVQSKSTVAAPKFQFHGSGYWLKTEAEMRAVRSEPWWQEACDNTQLLADRVADSIIPGHRELLPRFPTPEGFASNRDYIYHLLRDGARRIYGGITRQVQERVRMEMEVIEESGYIDYFLVVHDVIAWCLRNGILVGPGRGSAGGSLVAYLLGITRVDPIRYKLLFERFLERGRQEPPDIDIDFPQSRRDEVIQYLRDRWGEGNVAFIGTYQIARTRAAIKDAARVLGHSSIGNKMSSLVPIVDAAPMAMSELIDPAQSAAAEYRRFIERTEKINSRGEKDADGYPAGVVIHELAATFENVVKGTGLHASGIIVSAEPLRDLVPMRKTGRGWALMWTGPEAEQVGLLKIDVLGLRNLDIVSKAVEYIAEATGEHIDPLALPDPDDPEPHHRDRVQNAWRVIGEGRTEGLFQLESPKMTELAQDVAPHSLNDLSALVALFRPGPMGKGLHTEYAARKRDPNLASYRDYTTSTSEQEALETVLGETHGIIVYQEQVMMLGTVVSGFDAAERSTLRKAVSKKKKDVMEAVGAAFRDGAPLEHLAADGSVVSPAFATKTASALWDAMVSFAEYAFNRSHSATYGYLAYITAFLKGNWPVEFAAATLAVTSGTDKRQQVLRSLKREGITVLPPDVNAGNASTAPAGSGVIRIGLSEVKGLASVGEKIAAVRNGGITFGSISDIYERVMKDDDAGASSGSAVTSGHIRSLIEAGALDSWCAGNRLGLLSVAAASKTVPIDAPPMEWGTLERASRQRDALGLTIGEHPLVALGQQLRAYKPFGDGDGWQVESSVNVTSIPGIPDIDGASVTTIGILAEWSEKAYSRGRMASIRLEGSTASIAGAMWDRELGEHTEAGLVPSVGEVVAVTGRVRFRSISADTDDDEGQEQVIKELSVTRVRVVPIVDDSRDEWPAAEVVVPLLSRDVFGDEKDDEGGLFALDEKTPHAEEAEPVVEVAEAEGRSVETEAVEQAFESEPGEPVLAPIASLDQKRREREGTGQEEWQIDDCLGGVPRDTELPYIVCERPFRLTKLIMDKIGFEQDVVNRLTTKACNRFVKDAKLPAVLVTHLETDIQFYLRVGSAIPMYAQESAPISV